MSEDSNNSSDLTNSTSSSDSSSNSSEGTVTFRAQEVVREFTLGAANAVLEQSSSKKTNEYPNKPEIASKKDAYFITKMVISELLELHLTLQPNVQDVKETLHRCVDDLDLPTSKIPCLNLTENTKGDTLDNHSIDVIEAQMDAIADSMYYLLDYSTKKGYNIDRILDLVHKANMDKRHSDGRFHKRADGKVIKPEGWKEADLVTEVKRQLADGSW